MANGESRHPPYRGAHESFGKRLADYESKSERRSSKRLGRLVFLMACNEVAPQVADSLAERPLSLYAALRHRVTSHTDWMEYRRDCSERYGRGVPVVDFGFFARPNWGTLESASPDRLPDTLELRRSLAEWAIRHRLVDGWCLEIALRTLERWSAGAGGVERRQWAYGWAFSDAKRDVRLEAPPELAPRPFEETKEQYLQKAAAIFDAAAAAPESVKTRSMPDPAHFAWLVEFQVLGRSYGAIFEPPRRLPVRGPEAVKMAVKRTTELIELTRRTMPQFRRKLASLKSLAAG